jgi:hypothetical protein
MAQPLAFQAMRQFIVETKVFFSMRMGMRRFTRLTKAFSKKLENHMHALSIYFMHYNFVRIHQTVRVTPAMEAGVTDRLVD